MKHFLEWFGLVVWVLAGFATFVVAVYTFLNTRKSAALSRRMESELAENALLRKQIGDLFGEAKPKEPPVS